MRVMDAVRYYPIDGTAFEGERAAEGQKILHQLWRLEAAMCQESVKADSDPQASGYPPERKRS